MLTEEENETETINVHDYMGQSSSGAVSEKKFSIGWLVFLISAGLAALITWLAKDRLGDAAAFLEFDVSKLKLWHFIICLVLAAVVPLLSALDGLLRKLPLGELISGRVKMSLFDKVPIFRFLPLVALMLFMTVGATFLQPQFKRDAPWVSYLLFGFLVFSVLLLLIEAVINAGLFGALIHIPLLLAGNAGLFVAFIMAITGVVMAAAGVIGILAAIFVIIILFIVWRRS